MTNGGPSAADTLITSFASVSCLLDNSNNNVTTIKTTNWPNIDDSRRLVAGRWFEVIDVILFGVEYSLNIHKILVMMTMMLMTDPQRESNITCRYKLKSNNKENQQQFKSTGKKISNQRGVRSFKDCWERTFKLHAPSVSSQNLRHVSFQLNPFSPLWLESHEHIKNNKQHGWMADDDLKNRYFQLSIDNDLGWRWFEGRRREQQRFQGHVNNKPQCLSPALDAPRQSCKAKWRHFIKCD